MLSKDFHGTVQWQGFDRSAPSADGCCPEKRVVDRFFCGFDHGEEERRGRIVAESLEVARCVSFVLGERSDSSIRGS